MSEKSDWEQGYDQARRRFYGERKVLTARIAKLEEALNIDTDLTIAGLRKELRDATTRIAELEMKIRHNALWQASEDAEERAHLEKLVPDLKKRIAELEKDNDEFRQLIHDWIIILTPDDGYVPDSECNDVATPIDVALRKRIAKLEAERRWIPVSERMPDDWESVLTIDISKSTQDVVSAFYNPETSLWSTPFSSDLWVTHWMRLPEPPIVYGKVCEE
jgi:hypothetical protein